MIADKNPGYFDDFWTKPGHLGFDRPDTLHSRLVEEKTTITRIITAENATEAGLDPAILVLSGVLPPVQRRGRHTPARRPPRCHPGVPASGLRGRPDRPAALLRGDGQRWPAPDGRQRVASKVGEPVTLQATGEAPPAPEPSCAPSGTRRAQERTESLSPEADGRSESIRLSLTHTYTKPGTYFPSFRVGSRRQGVSISFEPVWNLARGRVVVSD